MDITPQVIEALRYLRNSWEGDGDAKEAFNVLDNAGIFAPIDEATGYDTDPEPTHTGPRKDPAEWGDLSGYQEGVGIPTLPPGAEIRPAFSDTHPRAARQLGELIHGDAK